MTASENVELVRRAFEAAARRPEPDVEALVRLFADDHLLTTDWGTGDNTTYRGLEGFRQAMEDIAESWTTRQRRRRGRRRRGRHGGRRRQRERPRPCERDAGEPPGGGAGPASGRPDRQHALPRHAGRGLRGRRHRAGLKESTVRPRTVRTGAVPTASVTTFARESWEASTRSQTRRAGWQDHHHRQRRRQHRRRGLRDLLVDLDAQCNATVALGLPKDASPNTYDCLADGVPLEVAAIPTAIEHLHAASTPDLAGASVELPRIAGSETRLRDALGGIRERYLFTLLDCPPSLGPLTVNALVAADKVIVPVQTEYFALEGLAGLLDTLSLIQRKLNPRLTVAGMILTMHDGRTRLARDVEREVREHFPDLVFDTVIPRNVRVGEAPSFGVPVTAHAPRSTGSAAYLKLAKEVAARGWRRGAAWAAAGGDPAADPEGGRAGLRELPVEITGEPNLRQPRRRSGRRGGSQSSPSRSARAESSSRSVVRCRPAGSRARGPVSGACARRGSPSSTVPAIVRDADDWERLDLALAENMARGGPQPGRRCPGARRCWSISCTRRARWAGVGRSRVAISNLIRLLELPGGRARLIEGGQLSEGHGRALLMCKDHDAAAGWPRRPATPAGPSGRDRAAGARGGGRGSPRGGQGWWSTPTFQEALGAAEDALSAALGQDVKARAKGDGCVVEIASSTAPPRRSRWRSAPACAERPRGGSISSGPTLAPPPDGRLAQLVRARL